MNRERKSETIVGNTLKPILQQSRCGGRLVKDRRTILEDRH